MPGTRLLALPGPRLLVLSGPRLLTLFGTHLLTASWNAPVYGYLERTLDAFLRRTSWTDVRLFSSP